MTTGLRGAWAAAQNGHPEKKLKFILVTGTDGKTTTSTLIYRLLQQAGFKVGLLSTVAAYIGEVSLDTGFHVTSPEPQDLYRYLRQMVEAGLEYVVLEVTSQGAYQYRTWGIKAQIAALTNVDREHLDYHLTFDNYLRAKMLVLNSAQTAVVNDAQEYFGTVKKLLCPEIKVVTFNQVTHFTPEIDAAIAKKMSTDYNRLNAIEAVTVAKQLDVSDQDIVAALREFELPAGRLEVIPTQLDCTMIVDFAHTPQALANVLPAIKRQYVHQGAQLIGIVGCAGLRDRQKRPSMGKIMAEDCDVAIFTAEDPRTEDVWAIIQQMKQDVGDKHAKVISIANREEALRFALENYAHDGNVIAIFGKGHEQSMNYDGKTETLWCDITGAQEILRELEQKK